MEVVRGISFPKDARTSEPRKGYIACLRTANVQSEVDWDDVWYVPHEFVRRQEQFVKPLDILISTANSLELVGKVAQVKALPFPATLGAFISLIRAPSELDAIFLCYQLGSSEVQTVLHNLASTTTNISNISTTKLAEIELRLAPLPEQHRIVIKIEELFTRLDAGVAALKRVQAALKRYRAALLKAACEGRLVPQDPNDEPAEKLLERILAERRVKWEADLRTKGKDSTKVQYAEPQPLEIDALPEGWCWASFDSLLVELKNGYFSQAPESEPPGIPILRISAVRPLSVNFNSPRYLREELTDKIAYYELRNGDLLFTRYNGSLDLVGVCGVVRNLVTRFIYPDKLIRARVIEGCVLPEYLEIYFATEMTRRIIEKKAKTTAGQQGIAGTDLKGIPVVVPPLAEQYRIVAEVERRLSVVQEMEQTVAVNLARAERLRQAILRRAFAGRLVPQDPNDEPAEKLLERIRSSRQEAIASPAKNRKIATTRKRRRQN